MKVFNKTYDHEYIALEKYEAGIVLSGAEVKSAKAGYVKMERAFVKIIDGEAFVFNLEISIYKFARPEGYDPGHRRKLLLNRKEIIRLTTKLASDNLTIIPISCYNKDSHVKLEIALSKGKKTWERKQLEKQRDIKRETAKEVKEYLKS